MPVSSEFVVLCRAQIVLLTQALGASISIVYLTNELVEDAQTHLVPIATYPESFKEQAIQNSNWLLPTAMMPNEPVTSFLGELPGLQPPTSNDVDSAAIESIEELRQESKNNDGSSLMPSGALVDQRQIVLPLLHDNVVFGLLVTRRDDRAWSGWEQQQIEEVARTLAIACVLDQRHQWLEHEWQQSRVLQAQQHDLMDNLLHQFRNSLTALQTFGKLILKRFLPGDRSHELAANLARETERLRTLANQMEMALEISEGNRFSLSLPGDSTTSAFANEASFGEATLETQTTPLLPSAGLLPGTAIALERVLVETVLAPLLSSFEALAQANGLTVHAVIPDDLPPVWANASAVSEVLTNFLENAIKYTPASGQIWVAAETNEANTWVQILVTDTGPGIPAQDLPHMFERHYRGVQADGAIPGTGLGLAIAKSLMDQMHGKIQVFSPALMDRLPQSATNQPLQSSSPGTTFLVELPAALETNPDH